jgi:hypothetical protein
MAASNPDDLARRLFAEPGSPDERSQCCLQAIRRALEEHGCELQVWVPVGDNGKQAWEIKVVPVNRENRS